MIGGTANTNKHKNSHIIGMKGFTSIKDDTVHVDNLYVSRSLTATSITSSIVTSSIMYSSGSNIFGDASTDTHTFNGDVSVSGGITGSNLLITSSTATNVVQIGATGAGGIQKWEWDRDGTRKFVIYNDGRTNAAVPQDSLVIKHGTASDGDNHINMHMEQDDQTVYFHGEISSSDNVLAKTYKSERLYVFGSVSDGEEYYFTIGGNPLDSAVGNGITEPAVPITETAMCNLKITKLKIQTAIFTTNVTNIKIYCRKWDDSGAFDNNTNWENVGTAWTVKSSNLTDNERFYHAPSDWTISAGEIWGLQIEHNGSDQSVHMSGGVIIEEDWNNQVSS